MSEAALFNLLCDMGQERLGLQHLKILASLAMFRDWRALISAVGEDCRLGPAVVWELALVLEDRGLAFREPVRGNSRAFWLVLTTAGHAVVQRLKKSAQSS